MKNKCVLLCFLPFLLTSCSSPMKDSFLCFDTTISYTVYGMNHDETAFINIVCRDLDKLFDSYHARDILNVYSINQTNDEVEIGEGSLYDILEKSLQVQSMGATYFNPLCGSLSNLWKNALDNNQVLSQETINVELTKINSSSLLLKDGTKVQRVGEAEIDLCGIAKGYALDVIKRYLDGQEFTRYIVNAGSSSILLGEKNTKDGLYNIGIKDIKNAYFKAKNCFVSTSGIREQLTIIDGVKYSHIVNPVTGSVVPKHDTVIVITDSGFYGDALSTSMMMNTVEEIQQIEIDHNVKAIVIDDNQITYKNSEIEVYYH